MKNLHRLLPKDVVVVTLKANELQAAPPRVPLLAFRASGKIVYKLEGVNISVDNVITALKNLEASAEQ